VSHLILFLSAAFLLTSKVRIINMTNQFNRKQKFNKNQTQATNERVENNLKVLKLLASNDCLKSNEEVKKILNEYSGWGGLRDSIYTPHI
jgi:hypothetical protein